MTFQSKKIDPANASEASRSRVLLNDKSVDGKKVSVSKLMNDLWQIALSDDELLLLVSGREASSSLPHVWIFDVASLAAGIEHNPIAAIKVSDDSSASILQISIRPMPEPVNESDIASALAVLTDNTLVHFSLNKQAGILATIPGSQGNVTAVSWSRKGKQFVVGDKSGRLICFEPNGMKMKRVVISPGSDSSVCDLLWLDNYNFAVAYSNSSSPQPQIMLVNSKIDPPVFTDFGDICFGQDDEHPKQYFLWHIHEWKVVLALSQTALDGAILSYNQQSQSWQLLNVDECARLQFSFEPPLAYPCGVALSLSPDHPPVLPDNEQDNTQDSKAPASPMLLVASSSGEITSFSIGNFTADAVNLSKSPTTLPAPKAQAMPKTPEVKQQTVPNVVISSSNQGIFGKVTPLSQPPVAAVATEPVKPVLPTASVQKPVVQVAPPAQPTPAAVNVVGDQKQTVPVPVSSPVVKPVVQQPQHSKQKDTGVIERELDEFVAAKLQEEIESVNELYAVWCQTVKPLLNKEAAFQSQAEADRKHFNTVLAEVQAKLDGYRSALADLEGGFKLLSARIVDSLSRAQEVKMQISAPVPEASPARNRFSRYSALSPRTMPTASPIQRAVSPDIRNRLKQSSDSVTTQLFASCGQQLSRLREMNKTLDSVYDALVSKKMTSEFDEGDGSSHQQVKNIYEAAYGLQKAVHLQKLFVAELHKKMNKLKHQMVVDANKDPSRPVVHNAVVTSFVGTLPNQGRINAKLSHCLRNNHRMSCIEVAPQTDISGFGKKLPKSVFKKQDTGTVVSQMPPATPLSSAHPQSNLLQTAPVGSRPPQQTLQPNVANVSFGQLPSHQSLSSAFPPKSQGVAAPVTSFSTPITQTVMAKEPPAVVGKQSPQTTPVSATNQPVANLFATPSISNAHLIGPPSQVKPQSVTVPSPQVSFVQSSPSIPVSSGPVPNKSIIASSESKPSAASSLFPTSSSATTGSSFGFGALATTPANKASGGSSLSALLGDDDGAVKPTFTTPSNIATASFGSLTTPSMTGALTSVTSSSTLFSSPSLTSVSASPIVSTSSSLGTAGSLFKAPLPTTSVPASVPGSTFGLLTTSQPKPVIAFGQPTAASTTAAISSSASSVSNSSSSSSSLFPTTQPSSSIAVSGSSQKPLFGTVSSSSKPEPQVVAKATTVLSTTSAASAPTGFSFAVPSTAAAPAAVTTRPATSTTAISSPFSFAAPSSISTAVTTAAPTTTTSNATGSSSFSFAAPSTVSSTVTTTATATSSTAGSSPFSFAAPSSKPTSTTTAAPSSSSAFGFAAPQSAVTSTAGKPSVTGSSGFSFASPPSTTNTSAVTTVATSTGFSFAAPSSSSAPTTTSSGFSFAAPSVAPTSSTVTTATSSAFSFAAPPNATSSSATGTSGFSFAAPSPSSSTPPTTSTGTSLFGQLSTSSSFGQQSQESKPLFGQASAQQPVASGSESGALFGGLFSKSMGDLGQSNSGKPASSGPFGSFGTSSVSTVQQTAAANTSMFAQTPSSSSGFSFGGQQPTSTQPSSGLFSQSAFGQAPTTPASSAATFGNNPASSGMFFYLLEPFV